MLPNELRKLAARLGDGADSTLLWRAARQLELLYRQNGMPLSDDQPEHQLPSLEAARQLGERKLLLAVIFNSNGNKAAAARRLNISRVALYKTLRKHGMEELLCH